MGNEIIINDELKITDDYLEIKAVRSSGPGGQNVNKVSTCIELRFNPLKWGMLSNSAYLRLQDLVKNKLDSDGNIILTSQKYREQYKNLEDVCEKLKRLIVKCLVQPKRRKATKPTKASVEKRIQKKKLLSMKKENRRSVKF